MAVEFVGCLMGSARLIFLARLPFQSRRFWPSRKKNRRRIDLRLAERLLPNYFFSKNSLQCLATASAIDCSFLLPPRCLLTE